MVHWIYHKVGKPFAVLLLIRKQLFAYTLALKMTVIKLVGNFFPVRRRSAKTVNLFSHIGFVVYGISKGI